MGTQKNATYKVHNGTDFDTIHFETGEGNLVNAIQSLALNGYRKLPNGLIIQWGQNVSVFANFEAKVVAFPIAFPSKTLLVLPVVISLTGYQSTAIKIGADQHSLTGFRQVVEDYASLGSLTVTTGYLAIGY